MPPEESENDEKESEPTIAKVFQRMFQKHLEFKEIRKGSTLKRNYRNSKAIYVSKIDTSQNSYYGYALPGHMIKENIKKKKSENQIQVKKGRQKSYGCNLE